MQVQVLSWAQKNWAAAVALFFKKASTVQKLLPARVAELVDAHVSGACSERSAGSSPVPGTKEILQVTLNERKSKIFFLLYPNLGHSLAMFSEKHT